MRKQSILTLERSVVMGLFFHLSLSTLNAKSLPDSNLVYEKQTILIPMRDGVRLNTSIYVPKNAGTPLPFLIKRSPYGIGDGISPEAFTSLQSSLKELVDEGYIFVFQDIRGRYKSEGTFVMMRNPRDKNNPNA